MTRPHLHPRSRDGFALPLTLLAMIVIGAVVTGGFYMSSQENIISISTDMGASALEIAEYGLEEVVGTWPATEYPRTAGAMRTFAPRPVRNGGTELGTYQIRILPLGGHLFMVESEGRVTRGPQQAVRRVAGFVRTTEAQLPYLSAISVFGKFKASGNAKVTGADADDCGPGDVAGVTAVSDSLVDQGNKERIAGNPPVDSSATLDPEKLSDFGDLNLDDLLAMATHTYPPNTTLDNMWPAVKLDLNDILVCDTSVDKNWGDPLRPNPMPDPPPPCMSYFPIIHAQGDLYLQTGTGQGVLVVDGNLSMTGNMTFYGVVIVRGSFHTAGTGNHINGALLVHGDGELDTESISEGNSLVQYASCRVRDAFGGLPVLPLVYRSWVADTAPLSQVGS